MLYYSCDHPAKDLQNNELYVIQLNVNQITAPIEVDMPALFNLIFIINETSISKLETH